MSDLPTGTVTFLFTDIEGSTRLWEQQPEAMRLALARHDALLQATLQSHGGHVFKSMGDQFCAAFATAPEALAAALTAQRALLDFGLLAGARVTSQRIADRGLPTNDERPTTNEAASSRAVPPGPGPNPQTAIRNSQLIRVRMALHTGAAEQRDGDYFGPPLNRVARLLEVAHGGQVLLSLATEELVRDGLPREASLRDLGSHRLKDLHQLEHIFQLLHPDLPSDFPSLRSLDALPNNLPRQLTSFIGREKEIGEVQELLSGTSLLTLTGSGGCGKTRLALQVAADVLEQYADGVWLVELAPLADPALVPQSVASALGVREEPGRPLTATLTEYLRPKSLLLILDNCEHLLSACAQLAESLLRGCPQLRILASSREGLGIGGEQTYRVPSLSLPDARHLPPLERLQEFEAVQLFADRARLSQATFTVTQANAPSVVQLCERLDGIPLAIELAAARLKVLSVEQLTTRLDDRFRLLTGGSRTALPRQQTLRALIDWSYDLLAEAERRLLRRLSVFAGGWTLEAAEGICAGDGIEEGEVLDLLSGLVDKSMVVVEEGAEARYRLLETVRQYARDRLLESGEAAATRRQHAAFFLTLAQKAEPELRGPHQRDWLDRLETEIDNMRVALAWATEAGASPDGRSLVEEGLRAGGALHHFWTHRGHIREGRERGTELLALPGASEPTAARARALCTVAWLTYDDGGDHKVAEQFGRESLAIYRALGDKWGMAVALRAVVGYPGAKLPFEEWQALCEESLSLFRELGDELGIADALRGLGNALLAQGDLRGWQARFEESLAIYRKLNDTARIALMDNMLGVAALEHGDEAVARRHLEESLTIYRELGSPVHVAGTLYHLGEAARYRGDWETARSHLEESRALAEGLGDRRRTVPALCGLAAVAHQEGDRTRAKALYRQALVLAREVEARMTMASCLGGWAAVIRAEGRPERAARLFGAVAALREATPTAVVPERTITEREIAATRAALDEEGFAAAWAEGRAMTLEEAVRSALEEPSDV